MEKSSTDRLERTLIRDQDLLGPGIFFPKVFP